MTSIIDSEEYKLFKSWVPIQKISIGSINEKIWRYYDYGPKESTPIVFLPGVSGTAEIYFRQIVSLCPKGFRIISVQYAPYESLIGFCKGFDRFLDKLGADRVHLFGTALGGYLAQCYYQTRPTRVQSLILNNSFCDTQYFQDNAPCSTMFSLMPEFMLKKLVLSNFPQDELEPCIAEAVDFMVTQLESLTQSELSSRLSLNCSAGILNPSGGLMHNITIIDTLDSHTIPERLREEVYKYYPNAKIALLKTGGDVSYLSKSDEINIHIQVHLRNYGYDPVHSKQQQLQQSSTTSTASNNNNNQNNENNNSLEKESNSSDNNNNIDNNNNSTDDNNNALFKKDSDLFNTSNYSGSSSNNIFEQQENIFESSDNHS